jgi:Dolichyl-phosphate-mannose-protein mannosyltransferase
MDKITIKYYDFFALFLLAAMSVMMFFSGFNDTATFDEVAHISAGYSYLTQWDMRLNPEHPPLVKDLAAIPLLFLNLNFPTNIPEWSEKIESRQWNMGKIFLYEPGNDPDQILHFSRFPVILLGLLLGWMIYRFVKNQYGDHAALLTLFFYAMSPTFIAHSRYVTTDTGASLGFFAAIIFFVNFLKNQTGRNFLYAGLALGLALLLKFSTVILAPIFILFGLLWVFVDNFSEGVFVLKNYFIILWKTLLIGLVALFVVYMIYIPHVWNYPLELQKTDTLDILTSARGQKIAAVLNNLSDFAVLRPLTQYFMGVASVVQRAGNGNAAHFMNTVYSEATPWYFPVLYLVKEHLAFHILTLAALVFAFWKIVKVPAKGFAPTIQWTKKHFFEVSFLLFIFVYAFQSITGNLNIGVRHIAPILPFIYILVAVQIVKRKNIFNYVFVGTMALWMMFNIATTFPYYLSYYNELAGGTFNGYWIATDSNYDWGQDMKRLKWWMDENKVPAKGEKIALHYFGGGSAKYYLGADNYEDWWSSKGAPRPGMYFAISANAREGSMATPVRGFTQAPEDKYPWLKGKTPIARVGSSIFIYKF